MNRRTAVLIALWLAALGLGVTTIPRCFGGFADGIQAQQVKRAALANGEG